MTKPQPPTIEKVNAALKEIELLLSLTKDPETRDAFCTLYTQTYCLKLRMTKEKSC